MTAERPAVPGLECCFDPLRQRPFTLVLPLRQSALHFVVAVLVQDQFCWLALGVGVEAEA
jgi:hypothetical protein